MNGGWVWGFGGMGSERNREGDNCTLLKISFHILQIKRAAASSPLPLLHFKKVCQKHMALHY